MYGGRSSAPITSHGSISQTIRGRTSKPPRHDHGVEAESVDAHAVRQGLRDLGLSGRAVCVHSSLRSFGRLRGGAAAFVDACLSEQCTVVVPTFSWTAFAVAAPIDLRPSRNGTDYSWIPSSTGRDPYTPDSPRLDAEEMGAIPADVLKRADHRRGDHPLCSFTAVGPLAAQLVDGQSWTDTYAPLRELTNRDGAVLLVGVDLTSMTLLHLAEAAAGREPFRRWALGNDGQVHAVPVGGCSNGFRQLRHALDLCMTATQVGASTWLASDASCALSEATAAIRSDPTITMCTARCERCVDATAGGPLLPGS